MRIVDLMLTMALAAATICGVASVVLSLALWRAVWKIPNLPLSICINPFNILAQRDLWTPSVEAASRRLTITATSMIGFILIAGAIAVLGIP